MNGGLRTKDLLTASLYDFLKINENSIEFINSISELFPPLAGIDFEINLNKIKYIDTSFIFYRQLNEFKFFSRDTSINHLPQKIINSGKWEGLFKFSEFLEDDGNMPFISIIWIEFDEQQFYLDTVPIPGVFFNFDTSVEAEVLCQAVEMIIQSSLSYDCKKNIYTILSHLPSDSKQGAIGFFLGRKSPKIRFNISLSVQELFYFINFSAIDFPYDLIKVIQKMQKYFKELRLNIDIDENKVEIQSIEVAPDVPESWNSLLGDLLSSKWCDKKIVDLVLKWPCEIQDITNNKFVNNNELIPKSFLRYINHIKIQVFNENKISKIYLVEAYRNQQIVH